MQLRYVILHHTSVADPHFDLMFESAPGAELMTWRSSEWPVTDKTVFTPLPPHRRDYLEYEGPVSRGRGEVKRVTRGDYEIVAQAKTEISVQLDTGVTLRLPLCE